MSRGAAKSATAALVAATLTLGCATWTLVNERVEVAGVYSVDPIIAWSASSNGPHAVWTIDGTQLQQVVFFNEIGDGEPLIGSVGLFASEQDKEELHLFHANMDPFEIEEFFAHSWRSAGWENVETEKLRPADFGPFDGYRFDLRCKNEAGLDYRGLVAGTVVEQELYLVVFLAAAIHSYDEHLEAVEAMLASIEAL